MAPDGEGRAPRTRSDAETTGTWAYAADDGAQRQTGLPKALGGQVGSLVSA